MWLAADQQPIWKKGGGHAIHVSDFICKTIRQVKLSREQISAQLELPSELRLHAFEAQKITYPRKGFDSWWDLLQLIEQVKDTISIFKHTHPNCISIFVFDQLSAHGGFAEDALSVNSMNICPGGKQRKLHNTVIPLTNPDPAPGKKDTCGQVQHMCFPDNHEDPELQGEVKGIKAVLMEQKSIWDEFISICKAHGITNPPGKCGSCTKSQVQKDTERCIAKVEDAEQQEEMSPMGEQTFNNPKIKI